MGKIKPAALLQQSKKKKQGGSYACTVAVLVTIGVFFLVILPHLWHAANPFQVKYMKKISSLRKRFTKNNSTLTLPDTVIMVTSLGNVTFTLFGEDCPKAVENFVTHSRNGYFDGVIFHRVIKNFMIQGGDPTGDGTGGESIWGENFQDEFHDHLKHEPYTLSMANSGWDTNGSQFFITVVETPWLNGKHTVFGRVKRGKEVVQKISEVKTGKNDMPVKPVKILKMVVEED